MKQRRRCALLLAYGPAGFGEHISVDLPSGLRLAFEVAMGGLMGW
jgi:hypothetical protein